MIDANALKFSRFCEFEGLFRVHLRQIHGFRQTVHSSVTDIDAIFSEKIEVELVHTELLVRMCVKLDDSLFDLAVHHLAF